jgi:hypothetical protein
MPRNGNDRAIAIGSGWNPHPTPELRTAAFRFMLAAIDGWAPVVDAAGAGRPFEQ